MLLNEIAQPKTITAAKVQAAKDRADRAGLAVERAQQKAGYARSNDRVRELRVKYQELNSIAFQMQQDFKAQQSAG